MVHFTGTIQQFAEKGEKTGWSYVAIPSDIANQLKPGNKKSFRIKGKLNDYPIRQLALVPMGNGEFILPLKASLRKASHKSKGAVLNLSLALDKKEPLLFSELVECLADSPSAKNKFHSMPKSRQMYYSKWIESGKSPQTRAKRILATILGMEKNLTYSEVLKLNAQSVNK